MSTTHRDLNVEVRQYPDQDYLGTDFDATLAAVGESVAAAYGRIFAHLARERVQPAGPPFLVAEPPADDRIHVLVGVPTATALNGSGDLRPGRLARGRAAVTQHHGPYDQLAPVYEDLRAWVASHGYLATGSPREVYLNDPAEAPGPADYLTEVVWPIA
jgi:effector-binding domain-containing protein